AAPRAPACRAPCAAATMRRRSRQATAKPRATTSRARAATNAPAADGYPAAPARSSATLHGAPAQQRRQTRVRLIAGGEHRPWHGSFIACFCQRARTLGEAVAQLRAGAGCREIHAAAPRICLEYIIARGRECMFQRVHHDRSPYIGVALETYQCVRRGNIGAPAIGQQPDLAAGCDHSPRTREGGRQGFGYTFAYQVRFRIPTRESAQ